MSVTRDFACGSKVPKFPSEVEGLPKAEKRRLRKSCQMKDEYVQR